MKLVRELSSETFRIFLFFEKDGERVSPEFASKELAEDWLARFRMSQHQGEERRSSHIDRRRLHRPRPFEIRAAGRREIDREFEFEDRAKWTLNEIGKLARSGK